MRTAAEVRGFLNMSKTIGIQKISKENTPYISNISKMVGIRI